MVKTNSMKAWVLASRPKTLTAAAVPVLIAIAYGIRDCQLAAANGIMGDMGGAPSIQWIPTVLCLLFAWVMQIDSNLVNDYFDYKHGNDDETRLGPKRACAEGWITPGAMKIGMAVTTCLGCVIGLPLIIYGGWEMVIVGIACVLFCFLYTTTLSYHGLGDLLVVLFFGIVPVCCSYYVIMPDEMKGVTGELLLVGFNCGLVVDTLLVVNNYRDRDNDRKAGKQTLILYIIDRWGERGAEWFYLILGIIPFLFMITAVVVNTITLGTASFLMVFYSCYIVLHFMTYKQLKTINHGKELNQVLGETARNIFIYGITTFVVIAGSIIFM